jgi:hypothetical protein
VTGHVGSQAFLKLLHEKCRGRMWWRIFDSDDLDLILKNLKGVVHKVAERLGSSVT